VAIVSCTAPDLSGKNETILKKNLKKISEICVPDLTKFYIMDSFIWNEFFIFVSGFSFPKHNNYFSGFFFPECIIFNSVFFYPK